MGGLFSHSKRENGGAAGKNRVTAHDRAVLDLKVQRDKLKQYQKKIQVVLEREIELARQAVREGKKQKAILLLKKKKYQESLLEKTEQQLMNLEEMVNSIEFALVEQKVIEGLKTGNDVLTELN
eukprot:Opistho-2@85727